MARPTKLTDKIRATICESIEHGVSFETACEVAGVAAAPEPV